MIYCVGNDRETALNARKNEIEKYMKQIENRKASNGFLQEKYYELQRELADIERELRKLEQK